MKRSDLFAYLAAACAVAPLGAGAQSMKKIRVGTNAGESLAEGLLASDGGFFKQAGLDVEQVLVTNGGAMTTGIVSGAIDIGPSNITSISSAYVHGVDLKMFSPSTVVLSSAPGTTVLAVHKDSSLRTAKDFAGKVIALSTIHDLQQAAIMTWLDANGVDSKSVQFLEIPNPEQLAAVSAKRVDAACFVEPFLTPAKSEIRAITRPYDALGPRLLTFGWVANKEFREANMALMPKLSAAIRATAIWANRNHDATAAIMSPAAKLPLDAFRSMNRVTFYDGKLEAGMIQPIIDASAKYGFLTKSFPATELFVS